MGSKGGAGLEANIWVDFNDDSLDFRSTMEQDYINWNPTIQVEIK